MKRLIALAGLGALAACNSGPTEEEIRADERTKMLEERVAQLEAEKAAPKNEPEPEEAKEPEPAPPAQTASSIKATSSSQMRSIGAYTAYIGQSDLVNSEGNRLKAPWQVLRQDRANVHRFGVSQFGDQKDGFFSSAKNRATMERMVANGSIDAAASRRLMNGDVSVRVDILEDDAGNQRVDVVVL